MNEVQHFSTFCLACILLSTSPGPNMIYLITRTITIGRKAGLVSLFGVLTGFIFYIILTLVGISALIFAIPNSLLVLKYLGIGYLLFLIYQTLNLRKNTNGLKKEQVSISTIELFKIGLLTNLFNPSVVIFYLTFFPCFLKSDNGSIFTQGLLLGTIQISISLLVNSTIILIASKVSKMFSFNPNWIRWQRWVVAIVLACITIKMILQKI